MTYNPDLHHRRSIRLKSHDYSSVGSYFVTVCVQGRACLLGEIAEERILLNDAGRMVEGWWLKIPDRFPQMALDGHVVMPNHFHGIVTVAVPENDTPPYGEGNAEYPYGGRSGHPHGGKTGHPHGGAPTVGDVMDWFKTMTTNAYIRGVQQSDWSPFAGRLWQRNYYERIIRNDAELSAIREYIDANPAQWHNDE
jgi:REP element-mobilizing transposase RayT